jgi:hypothetical protein
VRKIAGFEISILDEVNRVCRPHEADNTKHEGGGDGLLGNGIHYNLHVFLRSGCRINQQG